MFSQTEGSKPASIDSSGAKLSFKTVFLFSKNAKTVVNLVAYDLAQMAINAHVCESQW